MLFALDEGGVPKAKPIIVTLKPTPVGSCTAALSVAGVCAASSTSTERAIDTTPASSEDGPTLSATETGAATTGREATQPETSATYRPVADSAEPEGMATTEAWTMPAEPSTTEGLNPGSGPTTQSNRAARATPTAPMQEAETTDPGDVATTDAVPAEEPSTTGGAGGGDAEWTTPSGGNPLKAAAAAPSNETDSEANPSDPSKGAIASGPFSAEETTAGNETGPEPPTTAAPDSTEARETETEQTTTTPEPEKTTTEIIEFFTESSTTAGPQRVVHTTKVGRPGMTTIRVTPAPPPVQPCSPLCPIGYYCPPLPTLPGPPPACRPFTCVQGYYCPEQGLAAPLPCPAGKYCPAACAAPPTCPPGKRPYPSPTLGGAYACS